MKVKEEIYFYFGKIIKILTRQDEENYSLIYLLFGYLQAETPKFTLKFINRK